MLVKVISGCQTGSDQGGLWAAYDCGIPTSGWIPKGYRTQDGPAYDLAKLFGLQEHPSDKYPPRTFCNVRDAHATIRLATDFTTSGEKCTKRAIDQYRKPYFDVDMNYPSHPSAVADWVREHSISELNVAGNSESTSPGIGVQVRAYLREVFSMTNPGQKRVFTDPDGPLVIDEPAPIIPHPVIDRFSGDYRWLSNFHPHPVTIDQIFQPIRPDNFIYASTEFAYQAVKSDDPGYRELVRSCPKPSDAKRLGHDVKLRPGWDDLRVPVMEWLVRQKFQYPALRQLLLDTGDAELIEGNPWGDTYFGMSNGVGQNYLGRILMKVRKELHGAEKRTGTGGVGWQIWNARD